jgi:hypothetical protein
MASLYGSGWRQGSIVECELPLDAVVVGASGRPERSPGTHGLWAVATQDCDLDRADTRDPDPAIELRPLYTRDPPPDWGIRSARLRLTDHEYADANAPRLTVSPQVLTSILEGGAARWDVAVSRRHAFTTWLGLRYDRPAVRDHLVPLARRISTEVARNTHRTITSRVRDVLMQFDDGGDTVRYSLFGVLDDAADEDEVRAWLARIAQAVPTELGVADRIEAADADGIAFSTIETSYSADVSLVTWRRDQPDPEGAT